MARLETGPNPQADAEMDARMSQLFNLAIQGPAITKIGAATRDPGAADGQGLHPRWVTSQTGLIEKGDRDRVKKVRESTMHQRA